MWNSQVGAPARRHHDLHLRRQPGRPHRRARLDTLWRFAADAGATFFGAGAAFYASCLKAGVEPATGGRPVAAARHRLDRLAAGDRRATTGSGSTCRRSTASDIWLDADLRRHRLRRRLRRRAADAAGGRGRDAVPLPRRGGRGLERADANGAAAAGRRGRRAGLHEADAVDAAVLLERRRRPALPRQLLRHVPGGRNLRSGATATGSASRRAAARSSTAAATPPSTATASAWARPSCTARSRRCPRCSTAWWSTSSTSAARATCRCSSCCARAWCSTTR